MFIHTITYFNNFFLNRNSIFTLNRFKVTSIYKPFHGFMDCADCRRSSKTDLSPRRWIRAYSHVMVHIKIWAVFVTYHVYFPNILILALSKTRIPRILLQTPLQTIQHKKVRTDQSFSRPEFVLSSQRTGPNQRTLRGQEAFAQTIAWTGRWKWKRGPLHSLIDSSIVNNSH